MPRGLRVLPAEHPLRDGIERARPDAARGGSRGGAAARRTPARRGFAWARRTAGPRIRSSSRSSRWSRTSRPWGSRPARRSGLLRPGQAERLAEAGLDYYNHNLDSSAEFYEKIISTRTYADRLETLERVRAAGVKVCCGGIVGMGETRADRIGLLHTLATLAPQPESVPINELVPIPGHAARVRRAARSVRVRALHRRRTDPDAALARAAVRRPQRLQRRAAGALLLRGRELDLLRREAADDGQSRHRGRSAPVRALSGIGAPETAGRDARGRATREQLPKGSPRAAAAQRSPCPEPRRRAAREARRAARVRSRARVRVRVLHPRRGARAPARAARRSCGSSRTSSSISAARRGAAPMRSRRVTRARACSPSTRAAACCAAAAANAAARRRRSLGGDAERLPLHAALRGSRARESRAAVVPAGAACSPRPRACSPTGGAVAVRDARARLAAGGPRGIRGRRRPRSTSTPRSTCTTSATSRSPPGSPSPCSTSTGSRSLMPTSRRLVRDLRAVGGGQRGRRPAPRPDRAGAAGGRFERAPAARAPTAGSP